MRTGQLGALSSPNALSHLVGSHLKNNQCDAGIQGTPGQSLSIIPEAACRQDPGGAPTSQSWSLGAHAVPPMRNTDRRQRLGEAPGPRPQDRRAAKPRLPCSLHPAPEPPPRPPGLQDILS